MSAAVIDIRNLPLNTTIQANALKGLRALPDACIDLICTSPPYFGLRSYGPECNDIWLLNESDAACAHEWLVPVVKKKSSGKLGGEGLGGGLVNQAQAGTRDDHVSYFCKRCGAWQGQLGLEPTYQLFLLHLLQIFDECYRVLKPTGTLWVNLGDSYAGSGKAGVNPEYQEKHKEFGKVVTEHIKINGRRAHRELGMFA